MTMNEILASGELEGYWEGAAGEAAEIDGSVCAESTCGNCKTKGLEYHPYMKKGSYRAFAVCGNCGNAEEF